VRRRGSARREGDCARGDEQQRLIHTAYKGHEQPLEEESIRGNACLHND
jgi:hypothetical protein